MKKPLAGEAILLGAALCLAGCLMSSTTTGPVGSASTTVSTLAGQPGVMGSTDATGTGATFAFPAGVVLIGSTLYVCDSFNSTIRAINLTSGAVTTIAGVAGVAGYFDNINNTNLAAYFNHPEGIATDGIDLYVADSGNNAIRKVVIAGGVVSTLAGGFNNPLGICYSGANFYVTDSGNCTIDQVTTGGSVTVIAGHAGVAGSADGTGTAATFTYPEGIVWAGAGDLYITDTWNCTVRKVTTGGIVTTLAGQAGVKGDVDGTGAAANFNWPEGIAIDGTSAYLYVADTLNSVIRQVAIATGAVTTLAGQGGTTGSSDGAGNLATFNNPMRAVFAAGTPNYLYVADTYNETVRRIGPVP